MLNKKQSVLHCCFRDPRCGTLVAKTDLWNIPVACQQQCEPRVRFTWRTSTCSKWSIIESVKRGNRTPVVIDIDFFTVMQKCWAQNHLERPSWGTWLNEETNGNSGNSTRNRPIVGATFFLILKKVSGLHMRRKNGYQNFGFLKWMILEL